jgi:hypothetical protein
LLGEGWLRVGFSESVVGVLLTEPWTASRIVWQPPLFNRHVTDVLKSMVKIADAAL